LSPANVIPAALLALLLLGGSVGGRYVNVELGVPGRRIAQRPAERRRRPATP
jgi:hypothetical protein